MDDNVVCFPGSKTEIKKDDAAAVDREIISALESLLERARSGEIVWLSTAFVRSSGGASFGFWPASTNSAATTNGACAAVSQLQYHLNVSIAQPVMSKPPA